MTTEQIKYFLCIAKHLNYTAAAWELEISTPTLSRQIVALEEELGVKLFIRDNKKVMLTKSGYYMMQELSVLYDQLEIMIQNSQRISEGFSGTLSCGILEDITLNGIMQDNFHKYIRTHTDLTLELKRESYRDLLEGVLDGTYDCIISFLFSLDTVVSLNYKIIEDIEEGFLVSTKSPLAKEKYFTAEKFKNQTFILPSANQLEYAHKGAIEFCQKYGFTPKYIFAPDVDTATLWVEAGMGVSFSYSKSIGSYNQSMTFIPQKKGETMTRGPKIVLAWNENNNNPVLADFIKEFKGKNDK